MDIYEKLKAGHLANLSSLTNKYNQISAFRLALTVGFAWSFYSYYHTREALLFLPLLVLPVVFLLSMKVHQKITWKKHLKNALISINENELAYLKNGKLPFENGLEFTDHTHPYSYDLDIFGKHSLFQNLNRTGTHMGKNQLAYSLLSQATPGRIRSNQDAIEELRPEVEWRQDLLALSQIRRDNEESYSKLIEWSTQENAKIPGFINAASFITPFLVMPCFLLYAFTPWVIFGNVGLLVILLNLLVAALQFKIIKHENINSGAIDKILGQYGSILEKIEQRSFKSDRLNELQKELAFEGKLVSEKIQRLSAIFTKMDHIENAYAAPFLNGFFLFHIHVLRSLYHWRAECKDQLAKWLDVIGQVEALSSLANFSYNYPENVFPRLNEKKEISFTELGHPLIGTKARISNDVSFDPHPFFILTGSNMSGKSTFLRTLGINMVLANCGSVVCAKEASIHPLPVLVSMRLADSLSDSESYFFAEVKRLKEIMDALDANPGFVLLDEILRGTNSDDKRAGTVEVIKKMVAKKAIGAIATHDLEVCNTTAEYPDFLTNKRFEVEIIDNELAFDYKLRDGICQNKSATFLMEKMGVI